MKTWLTEHRFAASEVRDRIGRAPLQILVNVVVIAFVLTLPWLGFTLIENLAPLAKRLASAPEISIFLAPDASRGDAEALAPQLRAIDGVGAVRLMPREDALERLKSVAGAAEVFTALGRNPLPDAWIVRIAPATPVATQLAIVEHLRALPKVEQVQIDSAWVQKTEALLGLLRKCAVGVGAALGAVVVAVVFNTIRLQVLLRADEIELSRLVGATERFLRRPFYYLGTLQGAVGAALAAAFVFGALVPLDSALGEVARLYSAEILLRPVGAVETITFIFVGAALGWLGAMFAILTKRRSRANRRNPAALPNLSDG